MTHRTAPYESDCEISAQQMSDADCADVTSPAPAMSGTLIRTTVSLLGQVIPVALLLGLGLFIQDNVPTSGHRYTDPRDRVLSWAAWLSGSEFNPKENPFSSQYEFELPKPKPIDWQEFTFQPQQWQHPNPVNSR